MNILPNRTIAALSLACAGWAAAVGAHAAEITWRLQTVASAGTTEYKNLVGTSRDT